MKLSKVKFRFVILNLFQNLFRLFEMPNQVQYDINFS